MKAVVESVLPNLLFGFNDSTGVSIQQRLGTSTALESSFHADS